ncbi:MAG: nitrile hydratase accessory protein [Pseudomonadota bacterium]
MSPVDTHSIAPLPRLDTDPTFDHPWQAQVLALVDALIGTAAFSAGQWSATFGAALSRAEESGAPDTTDTYYQAALESLEHLLNQGGEIDTAELGGRVEQWRQAYLETPHGQPVELGNVP